ncbi:hypothetical protein [Halorarius litoreus]|uniref:hypothetical protein n=1 Tax=Halorarius litoreus TaxID=2962676 RepID=UPI0020CF50C8|nr:hypothetical protein [Halorarius litoreus]
MAKFTFLEVHLDGAKFTANAPGGKIEEPDEEPEVSVGEVGDEASSSGKGKWVAALVGLLFLVAVAAVAKKKLGGDADDPEIPELADRE